MIRFVKSLYWRHSWIRILLDWLGVFLIGFLFSLPVWLGIWLDANTGFLSFLNPSTWSAMK